MRAEYPLDGARRRTASPEDSFRKRWPDPTDDVRQRFRPGGRSASASEVLSAARDVVSVPIGLPSPTARPLARRLETYWRWFAVVLFIVITLDMLTTMYAFEAVGPAGEANPVVRFALDRGVLAYATLNLIATVVAIGCFAALAWVLRATDPPYDRYFEMVITGWLGLLLLAGLFVFVNNLTVIVHGRSLLG